MSITSAQSPQENHTSLKPEHTIKVFTFIIVHFAGLWIMWIRMMAVEIEPAHSRDFQS